MAGGDEYVEYPGGAKMEQEYYRLREDPHELENTYRSAGHNQIEKRRERLKALKNCLKAGCREAEDLGTRDPLAGAHYQFGNYHSGHYFRTKLVE